MSGNSVPPRCIANKRKKKPAERDEAFDRWGKGDAAFRHAHKAGIHG